MNNNHILEILRTTTSLTPAYAIAAQLGMPSFEEYVAAAEDWARYKLELSGADYFAKFIRAIDQELLYDRQPDYGTGGAFLKMGQNKVRTFPIVASEDEWRNADVIMTLGIDQVPADRYAKYIKHAENLLPPNANAVAYCYASTPRQRAGYIGEMLEQDRNFYPPEAAGFSRQAWEETDKPRLMIGHSFAAIWEKLAKNAASAKSLKNIRSLMFGMYPVWGKGNLPNLMPELKTGPEIYVLAGSDIMPYMSRDMAVMAGLAAMMDGTQAYRAFHHPYDKNKIFVLLAPGIIPAVVGDIPNYGGHHFVPYVQALGFGPGGVAAVDPRLAPVHQAVRYLVDNSPTLANHTLAEIVGAEKLDIQKLKQSKIDDNRTLAVTVGQLLMETPPWQARIGHSTHLLVQGLNKIRGK